VLATATGEFEDDYRSTTARLSGTFTTTQAVAKGTVVGAGLESLEAPDDGPVIAVVVVAVDQVITTKGAAPRTERNRLRMELVRPEDVWLVSRVERL
jgi:Mce-associated membrane protein